MPGQEYRARSKSPVATWSWKKLSALTRSISVRTPIPASMCAMRSPTASSVGEFAGSRNRSVRGAPDLLVRTAAGSTTASRRAASAAGETEADAPAGVSAASPAEADPEAGVLRPGWGAAASAAVGLTAAPAARCQPAPASRACADFTSVPPTAELSSW